MRVTFDQSVDAAYIYLGDGPPRVAWTYQCDPRKIRGMINLDFDAEGRLIGIEVIDASKRLAASLLAESERLDRNLSE